MMRRLFVTQEARHAMPRPVGWLAARLLDATTFLGLFRAMQLPGPTT